MDNRCIAILLISTLLIIYVLCCNNSKRFQHNTRIKVNKQSYEYVSQYRHQLLSNVAKLLDDLDIKYVISHGNLLEYVRGEPIYHDDDIDLRFDINDFWKWERYCKNLNNRLDDKYNLKYDKRIFNPKRQLYDGIQIRLIKFMNTDNIKEFNMDIHCDLVASKVPHRTWMNYHIDYSNLRKIKYLGTNTYAPSLYDSDYVLKTNYGKNYIKPNYKTYNIE